MSSVEQTLSIIKPDAVERNLADKIQKKFIQEKLKILKTKKIQISKEEASEFYKVHQTKPFYDRLCSYLSSGPIVVMVLEGNNAIADPKWPVRSEEILTPLFEQLIEDADLQIEDFIAKKGDVLLWHSRLMHRGSTPNDPDIQRRSCIAHYSGITHRPDMPVALSRLGGKHGYELNGYYFPINQTYV